MQLAVFLPDAVGVILVPQMNTVDVLVVEGGEAACHAGLPLKASGRGPDKDDISNQISSSWSRLSYVLSFSNSVPEDINNVAFVLLHF